MTKLKQFSNEVDILNLRENSSQMGEYSASLAVEHFS